MQPHDKQFDRQIIVLCVSWYTSFKLSLRDLVIMMADRGISVTHTTLKLEGGPKRARPRLAVSATQHLPPIASGTWL